MAILLKQSTATTLLLGPFVDSTDGFTSETGLTIARADVLLWKEGGTTMAQKNETTSATHRSNGNYTCPVDTTDTNTLGLLVASVSVAGALPDRKEYLVVPANVFNAWVLGTEFLGVDAFRPIWSIASTTLTVKKVDGTTTAHTKTIAVTPGASPITGQS